MTAGLEVVVVTYGATGLVRECLRSVFDLTPPGTVVHVVDNVSPDGCADVVAAEFPEVRLTRQTWNSGFAVANNVALRSVGAPYVLILNPDARLEAGTVQHLLEVLDAQPEIGVIGCRLLTADGTLDHAAKRMFPSPLDALGYFAPWLRATGSRYTAPDVGEHDVGEVDAVNGAFMLVRRAALAEVGLLDERYWMYAEDLDWCARFRARGWKVVYDGRVTAHHLKAGSSGTARSLRLNYHFHRSMDIFYRAHTSSGRLPVDLVVRTGIWARFLAVGTRDSLRRAFGRVSAHHASGARP